MMSWVFDIYQRSTDISTCYSLCCESPTSVILQVDCVFANQSQQEKCLEERWIQSAETWCKANLSVLIPSQAFYHIILLQYT